MKKLILIFLLTFAIYSDTTEGAGGPPYACPSNLDDHGSPAFITFYGDSLGDFVDSITHGIYGWGEYLKIHRSEVDWRVQNMAVVGRGIQI